MLRNRRGRTDPDDRTDTRASDPRQRWVDVAVRLADPVLDAAAARRLRADMPVDVAPAGDREERAAFTHLEAVGRLLAGLAPWFELPADVGPAQERRERQRLAELAREAIRSGVDPASPDRWNVTDGLQPLVDAAYLAQALLRAPTALFHDLDDVTRSRLLAALRATRRLKPSYNNKLLFSAAIEAALLTLGDDDWDPVRVDYALRQHEAWHVGDGAYQDGAEFAWDYYGSYVIHPFLVEVVEAVAPHGKGWPTLRKAILPRFERYAAVQERTIGADGTYPPVGRSLAYRTGAFHALALAALRGQLPCEVEPAQVRGALTAVIDRQLGAPGTFDAQGWLTIGFAGHQPSIGERYISTGSLYLCATVLLPLGLPPAHPFWSDPLAPWTAVRAWGGDDIAADAALRT